MSEATARPWHADEGVILSEHGQGVALACGPGQIFAPRKEVSEKRRHANTAFIVKAANAHDALVAALETIQVQTQDPAIERLCAVALEGAKP